MPKKMTVDEKDQYIEQLEKQLANTLEKNKSRDVELIMQAQEEFLISKYVEIDRLNSKIHDLTEDVQRLSRTIIMDQRYIDYLINSTWWKMTYPFRKISRKLKQRNSDEFQLEQIKEQTQEINTSVSVVIFTYNAGREFSIQLENIQDQKLIKNINIIVIDKGSTDDTIKIAKEKNVTIIDARKLGITDEEIYAKCLPEIDGKYVIIINQNKIVNSKYWIYQSILPLEKDTTTLTIFLNKNYQAEINELKNELIYHGMKNRLCEIATEEVLFLPKNRDIVLYMTPNILDKTDIIIKKKSSNLFLL